MQQKGDNTGTPCKRSNRDGTGREEDRGKRNNQEKEQKAQMGNILECVKAQGGKRPENN